MEYDYNEIIMNENSYCLYEVVLKPSKIEHGTKEVVWYVWASVIPWKTMKKIDEFLTENGDDYYIVSLRDTESQFYIIP